LFCMGAKFGVLL